ncbi:MAG: PEP-CTERM system histidine kinase PrsK [Woeseiaceae bacterium]|nr:PEP-CTERM system histidine kinase PrsK [Woeseiaceae bacterium]
MSEIGTIGYAAAGVLYTLLTVLLLVNWRGQQRGGLLILACLLSVAWATVIATSSTGQPVPEILIFTVEVMRGAGWLVFLAVLLARAGIGRSIRYLGILPWSAVLIVGFAFHLGMFRSAPADDLSVVLNPGGLLIALVGLVLIEQLVRNAPDKSRRGINALALGLGGMFAYDLFLYSQGVLIGGVEPGTWLARGAVNVIFVPFIAIAARRNPDWNMDIFVSRHIVFYTTSLAGVGIYLLAMSAVGYWFAYYGGSWGILARLVFFAGAGLLLVVLLFSGRLRARLKVFLSKHFFRNKYDYREEWLRLTATLAAFEDSSTRQIVIKALAQIVASPSGWLWVLDEKKASFQLVASYETTDEVPDIPADDPLVKFIRKDSWLVDLAEFERKPERYGDLKLSPWLEDIGDAWLAVPLITRQQLLGLALLSRAPGPPELNYEDRDLLKTVGNHIAVQLAQDRTDAQLVEARQFEAYNRLTAFLMHDLNNLIAQQSLIVTNAAKHKRNPEFVDDAMNTIAHSVDRMKRVMDQLKRGEAYSSPQSRELKFMVSAAVDRCGGVQPEPTLELEDGDEKIKVDAEQFTMVLTHLIRNAQDATPADGTVTVRTACENGAAIVTVADSGAGMTLDFVRDRMFRPFDSTKGSQRMGIGAYQAREFAQKMGGDLRVTSEVGTGTTVTISLPLN